MINRLAVVDFLLGECDSLDTASALIAGVADVEEEAFRMIRPVQNVPKPSLRRNN